MLTRRLCTALLLAMCIGITVSQNTCGEDQIITSMTNFTTAYVRQVVFATEDLQDVYVRVDGNLVYRSVDGGSTFTPIMDDMPNFYTEFGQSNFGVRTILPGAADGLVYFVGASSKIYWITRGDGDYKEHQTGDNYIASISPHPENGDLVLRSLVICTQEPICTLDLEVSSAQGTENTWVHIRDYVYEYSWGGQENQIIFVSIPEELMTGNFQDIPIENQRLYMSLDLGENIEFVSNSGLFAFLYQDGVVYAAKYDNSTARSDLFISPDSGETFEEAQFHGISSVEHVDSSLYIVLDNTEDVSFLSVCRNDETMVANLFQANLGDGKFWLNRPNLRATCDPRHYRGADFQRIESLEATYFSNGFASEAFDDEPNLSEYIVSAISFNKGGTWTRISAPEGSECASTPDCYLHLFSIADSNVRSIYSTDEASGIIIATGTEGRYRQSVDEANTYLSRNGGYTWEMIKEGTFTYSTSNYGSLFVMASLAETNEIFYSWDQGSTWLSCILDTEPLHISSIMDISASADESRFMLIGTMHSDGFISVVSFDNVVPSECQGFSNPGGETSDFELFQPEAEGSCLLGKDMSFVRRKRSATCRSQTAELATVEGNCECTRLDYTCDGDCWKEATDGQGNLICANDCLGEENDPQAPPADCQGTYLQPSGYRPVEGDSCEGGLELDAPLVVDCPVPSPVATPVSSPVPSPVVSPVPSSVVSPTETPVVGETTTDGLGMGMIIGGIGLALMLLLLVLIVLIIILYKTNSKVRGLINTYLPSSMGGGSGDTKLYSVLGDSDEVNSLFADDDMFLDDNVSVPVSKDKTQLTSLLDFDDDDAEGAIDIQL